MKWLLSFVATAVVAVALLASACASEGPATENTPQLTETDVRRIVGDYLRNLNLPPGEWDEWYINYTASLDWWFVHAYDNVGYDMGRWIVHDDSTTIEPGDARATEVAGGLVVRPPFPPLPREMREFLGPGYGLRIKYEPKRMLVAMAEYSVAGMSRREAEEAMILPIWEALRLRIPLAWRVRYVNYADGPSWSIYTFVDETGCEVTINPSGETYIWGTPVGLGR